MLQADSGTQVVHLSIVWACEHCDLQKCLICEILDRPVIWVIAGQQQVQKCAFERDLLGCPLQAEVEMRKLHQIYAMYTENQDILKDFMGVAWGDADTGKLTMQTEELMKRLLILKQLSTMPAFSALEKELQGCLRSLGLIKELHSDAMRKRHWEQIAKITGRLGHYLISCALDPCCPHPWQ